MTTTLAPTLPAEFTITATDEDFLLGIRYSLDECGIARAARRELVLRGYAPRTVQVDVDTAWFGGDAAYEHNGAELVAAFDHGERVNLRPVHFKRA